MNPTRMCYRTNIFKLHLCIIAFASRLPELDGWWSESAEYEFYVRTFYGQRSNGHGANVGTR